MVASQTVGCLVRLSIPSMKLSKMLKTPSHLETYFFLCCLSLSLRKYISIIPSFKSIKQKIYKDGMLSTVNVIKKINPETSSL